MKRNNLILMLVLICFFIMGTTSFFYFRYNTLSIEEYPMFLLVGDKLGIDVGSDIIRFGRIKPGGGSSRTFVLQNDYSQEVKINMRIFGDLESYASLSDNHFVLVPNETKEVMISVGVPNDLSFGNYTGTLRVITERK